MNPLKCLGITSLFCLYVGSLVFLPVTIRAEERTAAQMKELFEMARGEAFQKTAFIDFGTVNVPHLTVLEQRWLVLNREILAADLRGSAHDWNMGNFQTCAYTDLKPLSAIHLSVVRCESDVKTASEATLVLLEQSFYHMGINEEQKAKTFAWAVAKLGQPLPVPTPIPTPPPQINTTDVYDPNICAGPLMSKEKMISYFQPGNATASVPGSYGIFYRTRSCNEISGCGVWRKSTEIKPPLYNSEATNPHVRFTTQQGKIVTAIPIGSKYPDYYLLNVDPANSAQANRNIEFLFNLGVAKDNIYLDQNLIGRGSVRSNCVYYKFVKSTQPDWYNNYVDQEIVVYGIYQ